MKKKLLGIVIFIAIIIYGVLHYVPSKQEPKKDEALTRISVTTAFPKQKTIKQTTRYTGVTIAHEEIQVTTELAGVRVLEVRADVGDTVEKGQVLAVLDVASFKNQMAQLQSDFDRTVDEFNRMNGIKDTGAVSAESVVQKRTAMESAKARLDDAKLTVKRGLIIAPDSGLIYERKAMAGALVNNADPLYRLAKKGEIEIQAQIPEADLAMVQNEQNAILIITGQAESIKGKVRLITPSIDAATRTANVRIAFVDRISVPIGIFADVDIEMGDVTGAMVPSMAIQEDADGTYVWQLDAAGKASRLNVVIKKRITDFVVIEDVSDTIQIVARAGSFIKEGEIVNVVEESTK